MSVVLMHQQHLHSQAQHLTNTMPADAVGALCIGAWPAPCAQQADFDGCCCKCWNYTWVLCMQALLT